MTILDALKGLYAKLGGKKSPDNIQTIGEALEDITTVAVNGSDALPAVTAEDNGDVLTVVEGAWANAAPSGGGGGVFIAHAAPDETDPTKIVISESFADAASAIQNDTPVILVLDWLGSTRWLYPNEVSLTDDPESLSSILFLTNPTVSNAGVSVHQVMWLADDSVESTQHKYPNND